jgi:hypothetical protein
MDTKGIARALRAQLRKMGHTVSHSESLELVAGTAGLKDWNVLAARQAPVEKTQVAKSACYCPTCGAVGTVSIKATAFVEQGPYRGDVFAFEGDADHYVCSACNGQFLDWSSEWPALRTMTDMVLLIVESRYSPGVLARLYPLGGILACLGAEDHAAQEVIERGRREVCGILALNRAAAIDALTLADELSDDLSEREATGATPREAVRKLLSQLTADEVKALVNRPSEAQLS